MSEESAWIGSYPMLVNGVNVFHLQIKTQSNYSFTVVFLKHLFWDHLFYFYVNNFPNSCKNIVLFLFAEDAKCPYVRSKNETSSWQDEDKPHPYWMATNKLRQNFPKS